MTFQPTLLFTIYLLLFPALASATLHHLFVGPLQLTKTIYLFTFDDSKLTLNLTRTFPAASPHSLLAFNHNKTLLYGVALTGGQLFTRYDLDLSATSSPSISSPKSIKQAGTCTNDGTIYVAPLPVPPYTVYGQSWPSTCGTILNHDFSAVLQGYKYAPESAIHGSALTPNNSLLLSADLRGDSIWGHAINATTGLLDGMMWRVRTPTDTGPRHVAVSKNGKFLYAVMEHTSQVLVYNLTVSPPTLASTWSIIPSNKKVSDYRANTVAVSASGNYVWASTRSGTAPGYIAAFRIDEEGAIVERLLSAPTTTSGTQGNGVTPASWSDEFIAFADWGSGYLQIWRFNETDRGFGPVAKVDVKDKGCCSMGLWYD